MQQKCCITAEAAWGRTGHAVASSQLRITLAASVLAGPRDTTGHFLLDGVTEALPGRVGRAWPPLTRASRRRRSKPSGDGPVPRLQVQPRVLDPLKAPLALVDEFLQDPLPRIQIRVPDSVGVPGVELVGLWHAAGVLNRPHPHRHFGGSPFHQQIAMSWPESTCTLMMNPGRF
jgi:hypothetical protein